MEKKEKVKYFNQQFFVILNKFHVNKPLHDLVAIEYYTSALHANIAMFVKKDNKETLIENFTETLTVEKDMLTIGVYHI